MNTGRFMGRPPTGQQVVVPRNEVFRLQNGWITEFWRHDNELGLTAHLGVARLPGRCASRV
jgi:predicted ester cyclase